MADHFEAVTSDEGESVADYRLSVNVIGRAGGRSSVAAAAYRAADRFEDERTGDKHDYTRKQGVLHSEILAPDKTPSWMLDRSQLWNGVEKAEKRKDAQLAREVQLSLPHELTSEQRRDLVRDFVAEQFVSRGMIADIAIHAPDAKGDERNHHAHIMLTMREITGEGFGKKDRSWNDKTLLENWREKWAYSQNQELERHGHKSRVDHRSFEERGIDREPSQHLGHVASDMERNGKRSRIGDENRETANDNRTRAENHRQLAETEHEKHGLELWADTKRREIEAAQALTGLDLSQKHQRQKLTLEARLEERNATAKATLAAEIQSIDRKLEAKGVHKILRDVFGKNRNDREAREDMQKTLTGIRKRESEERRALEKRQALDLKRLADKQERRRKGFDKSIDRLRENRERRGSVKNGNDRKERIKARTEAKPSYSVSYTLKSSVPSHGRPEARKSPDPTPPAEAVRKADEPSLDDKKNTIETRLDEKRGDLKRPWESSLFDRSNDNSRPWESDLFKPDRGRDRSPSPSPSGGGKGDGGGKT